MELNTWVSFADLATRKLTELAVDSSAGVGVRIADAIILRARGERA